MSLILLDILFSFGPRISQLPPYDMALTPPPAKGVVGRGDVRSQDSHPRSPPLFLLDLRWSIRHHFVINALFICQDSFYLQNFNRGESFHSHNK